MIVNCSGVRPLMGLPALSVTSTSMRTKSDEVRSTAAGFARFDLRDASGGGCFGTAIG